MQAGRLSCIKLSRVPPPSALSPPPCADPNPPTPPRCPGCPCHPPPTGMERSHTQPQLSSAAPSTTGPLCLHPLQHTRASRCHHLFNTAAERSCRASPRCQPVRAQQHPTPACACLSTQRQLRSMLVLPEDGILQIRQQVQIC